MLTYCRIRREMALAIITSATRARLILLYRPVRLRDIDCAMSNVKSSRDDRDQLADRPPDLIDESAVRIEAHPTPGYTIQKNLGT